ncbi:phosphohistidine phosphatase SixA [Utexia brackfieldae]|uniref:phosphohistidine phosphatase SixA n=1 Tax=Utexia brackfieldae TaxID=3074108 RepID=UPI00370DD522
MKVYIMRHGEAGYHALSDADRALTDYGVEQSRAAALWLKSQSIQLDYALVSPYLRAKQTFEAVSGIMPIHHVETCDALTPDGSSQFIADYLSILATKQWQSVLIVSHLPLVGYLVNELCPAVTPPMFATASIACVTLSAEGKGELVWQHRVA